ncbi:MAG: 6-carboxytetrahydropterin synthase [bacterium]|nr:6-carboxytetrahydropterin synthase [bacterium]
MYELMIETTAHIAHRLLGPTVGECGNIHGHTYRFRATFAEILGVARKDDMIQNFRSLKKRLEAVVNMWDHALVLGKKDILKGLVDNYDGFGRVVFLDGSPTAENMAEVVGQHLHSWALGGVIRLVSVEVWETDTCACRYTPED